MAEALDLPSLVAREPLLAAAWHELQHEGGIRNETADALERPTVSDVDLAWFTLLAARAVEGYARYSLAISLPAIIDRRSVGHGALSFCLTPGRMSDEARSLVAFKLLRLTSDSAIRWAHHLLTTTVRLDHSYSAFLRRHADVVCSELDEEAVDYLLRPDRGPGAGNLEAFEAILMRTNEPGPLQRRILEWIDGGRFDLPHRPGNESSRVLYQLLTDRWSDDAFEPVADAMERHVGQLLGSSDETMRRAGLFHLVMMVDGRYAGAGRVLHRFASIARPPEAEARVLPAIRDALGAVARYHLARSPTAARDVDNRLTGIWRADTELVTGAWSKPYAEVFPERSG